MGDALSTRRSYFFLLQAAAAALAPLGARACLFLAAAVSDFFVPQAAMATHKIQSAGGPLELVMPQVPPKRAYLSLSLSLILS